MHPPDVSPLDPAQGFNYCADRRRYCWLGKCLHPLKCEAHYKCMAVQDRELCSLATGPQEPLKGS